jgi:hypothetical protein
MKRALMFLVLAVSLEPVIAADSKPVKFEKDGIVIRVRPHTPPQMSAFYEARGFPPPAFAELDKACFMTVSIANQRRQILWLETARWSMTDASGKEIILIDRDAWDQVWQQQRVPPAARTAFRWTQLPRTRDLHPDEPVGGNISFAPGKGPYTLLARFALGPDKNQGQLEVKIPDLTCPGR